MLAAAPTTLFLSSAAPFEDNARQDHLNIVEEKPLPRSILIGPELLIVAPERTKLARVE